MKLKTNSINYKNGAKNRDTFDDLMERDEKDGTARESGKLARGERNAFGNLERIALAEKKLADIRRGKSHLAIAQ